LLSAFVWEMRTTHLEGHADQISQVSALPLVLADLEWQHGIDYSISRGSRGSRCFVAGVASSGSVKAFAEKLGLRSSFGMMELDAAKEGLDSAKYSLPRSQMWQFGGEMADGVILLIWHVPDSGRVIVVLQRHIIHGDSAVSKRL
jgi:hypothetical protein